MVALVDANRDRAYSCASPEGQNNGRGGHASPRCLRLTRRLYEAKAHAGGPRYLLRPTARRPDDWFRLAFQSSINRGRSIARASTVVSSSPNWERIAPQHRWYAELLNTAKSSFLGGTLRRGSSAPRPSPFTRDCTVSAPCAPTRGAPKISGNHVRTIRSSTPSTAATLRAWASDGARRWYRQLLIADRWTPTTRASSEA